MPQTDTYSFSDIYCVISIPGFPSHVINGEGVGSIMITPDGENTVHERAADGVVMPSKIAAANGSVTISCLQTSVLQKFLIQAFNYLRGAASSQWAQISITVSSPLGQFDNTVCKGVSFQKRADRSYEASGQMFTWTFLAADIQYQS